VSEWTSLRSGCRPRLLILQAMINCDIQSRSWWIHRGLRGGHDHADGSQLPCSEVEHPDIYAATRLGLDALEVIIELTLQCVPAFRLHAVEELGRLDEVLDGFDDMVAENDHVDFYWLPHAVRTLIKRNNRMPIPS
jgi:hypothetical protein